MLNLLISDYLDGEGARSSVNEVIPVFLFCWIIHFNPS